MSEEKQVFDVVAQPVQQLPALSIRDQLKVRFGEENIKFIKSKVGPNASVDDFGEYLYLCDKYGLDPLSKEAYLIPQGNKHIVLVSRDGLVKIANQHPMYDGMEGDVIYEGDTLTRRDNGSVKIEYGEEHTKFDKTKIFGAFCNVYRKDRNIATAAVVNLKDYDKGRSVWLTHKAAMILKCAEAVALRKSFDLSGLLSREEME